VHLFDANFMTDVIQPYLFCVNMSEALRDRLNTEQPEPEHDDTLLLRGKAYCLAGEKNKTKAAKDCRR
jgi:hypothetical protein